MNFSKTLNLLPQEYKDKYLNKLLIIVLAGVLALLVLIGAFMLGNIAYNEFWTHRYITNESVFIETERLRNELKAEVEANRRLSAENAERRFPFYEFMKFIETQKPAGLVILSIDSDDRVPNTKDITALTQPNPASTPSASAEPSPPPATTAQTADSAAEPESKLDQILKYKGDISGRSINIRGYSANPHAISDFIYNISNLNYVDNLKIIAIEEHKTTDDINVDIFEVEVKIK